MNKNGNNSKFGDINIAKGIHLKLIKNTEKLNKVS
jgi:hypothetical protein